MFKSALFVNSAKISLDVSLCSGLMHVLNKVDKFVWWSLVFFFQLQSLIFISKLDSKDAKNKLWHFHLPRKSCNLAGFEK